MNERDSVNIFETLGIARGLNASEKGRQGNHVTVGDAIYNKNCVVVVGHGETSNGKLAPPGGHGRFM